MYTSAGYVPAQISSQRPARTRLTQSALIRVTGPDSERFLQGQLTCDVRTLGDDNWAAGACCTAKGRMVANFLIVRTEDGFVLRLPAVQAERLIAHLKKYMVFFKAQMTVADDLYVIGELGSDNTARSLTRVPELCLNHSDGRREYWVSASAAENLLSADQCTEADWYERELRSGWVWVIPETTEAWVPQHIGWQHLEGISFSKGCYTGQEIVARLQYLGKSKQNLYLVESSTPLPAVMTSLSIDGRDCGELAAVTGKLGLAVISSEDTQLQATCQDQSVVLSRLFYTEENS